MITVLRFIPHAGIMAILLIVGLFSNHSTSQHENDEHQSDVLSEIEAPQEAERCELWIVDGNSVTFRLYTEGTRIAIFPGAYRSVEYWCGAKHRPVFRIIGPSNPVPPSNREPLGTACTPQRCLA